MAITNKWLSTYQRSFQSIKAELISKLQDRTKITDISEGNILILIISMFSAIAEVIHFYIDNQAREMFLPTARKVGSVVYQANLVDYHPKGAVAPSVDLYLTRLEDTIGAITIPKDTAFYDSLGNPWLTNKDHFWPSSLKELRISVVQRTILKDISAGDPYKTDTGVWLIPIDMPTNEFLLENTAQLTLGNTPYTYVRTLAKSKPTDKHFIIVAPYDSNPYIQFGDGVFGAVPTEAELGSDITFLAQTTLGQAAAIASNDITSTELEGVIVNNPYPSTKGYDIEDFYTLKRRVGYQVSTQGMAITKQDFVDLAKSISEVNQCGLDYECGRRLNLYIVPFASDDSSDPPIASTALCNTVKEYLLQYCPLTTWLNVLPAGITAIHLDLTVTGRKGYTSSIIRSQIIDALNDQYSFMNTPLSSSVRISDIYALIDNLESVDYLYINQFFIQPWPKTVYGPSLTISDYNLDKADKSVTYRVVFGNDTVRFYASEGGFVSEAFAYTSGSSIQVVDNYNGVNLSIAFTGTYTTGNQYLILVTSGNADYEETGFNTPCFKESDLTLTINETLQ